MVSLRLSLRCAVHTATYAAALQEDQPSERGRRLLAPLRTGCPRVLLRSPAALASSLLWLVTTWLRAATSVTARNKRLQQHLLCASVCFVGSSGGRCRQMSSSQTAQGMGGKQRSGTSGVFVWPRVAAVSVVLAGLGSAWPRPSPAQTGWVWSKDPNPGSRRAPGKPGIPFPPLLPSGIRPKLGVGRGLGDR